MAVVVGWLDRQIPGVGVVERLWIVKLTSHLGLFTELGFQRWGMVLNADQK